MKKFVLVVVAFALLAFAAGQAQALSLDQSGSPYRAKIEDFSNLWDTSGNPVPLAGPGGIAPNYEQRTLFHVTNIFDKNNQDVFNTGSSTELTGLVYDLKVIGITFTTPTTVILDFGIAGRNPVVGDTDGDLASLPGGYVAGGVVEVYEDPTKDFTPNPGGVADYETKLPGASPVAMDAGAGPTLWTTGAASHAAGSTVGADTFPTGSDGSLWLQAVFLELQYLVDQGALLAPGVAYTPGTVLREQIDFSTGTGFGQGFLNVVGGSFSPMIDRPYQDTALVDLTLRFNLSTALYNPANGQMLDTDDYVGPGQWTVESEDPVRFGVIPEPATISLLGIGLLGAAGLRRRKK